MTYLAKTSGTFAPRLPGPEKRAPVELSGTYRLSCTNAKGAEIAAQQLLIAASFGDGLAPAGPLAVELST
jgi:hypothetical protein